MAQSFPLLAVNLALFAALNFISAASGQPWYLREAFSVPLTSGDLWSVQGGSLFELLSLALLFIEILRATRSSPQSIANHVGEVAVFVAALLLFLMQPGFGNSTFFVFVVMTLLDFLAGFIITTVAARRDISLQEPRHQF